jgi:hypothetical protein
MRRMDHDPPRRLSFVRLALAYVALDVLVSFIWGVSNAGDLVYGVAVETVPIALLLLVSRGGRRAAVGWTLLWLFWLGSAIDVFVGAELAMPDVVAITAVMLQAVILASPSVRRLARRPAVSVLG